MNWIDDWPEDSATWCDAEFGPSWVDDRGKRIPHSFQCRKQKGHDGPHDCHAAQEANYTDVVLDLNDPMAIERFLQETP